MPRGTAATSLRPLEPNAIITECGLVKRRVTEHGNPQARRRGAGPEGLERQRSSSPPRRSEHLDASPSWVISEKRRARDRRPPQPLRPLPPVTRRQAMPRPAAEQCPAVAPMRAAAPALVEAEAHRAAARRRMARGAQAAQEAEALVAQAAQEARPQRPASTARAWPALRA
jgi:hypothetical protein